MKKILSILILVSCFFASKAQVPMLSSDYLFKNRVSVGAQSLTGTPTSVWFKIGDSASNKGFITPTVKHLDSVPYPRYRGLQVWDLDTGLPYWWNGTAWVSGGGSEETVLFRNGLLTSKDTLLRWESDDTLIFRTFKPGWGLIQSTTSGVYTDTTWGTDIDSATVKAWILTFVQEATDSTAILINAPGGGYELINFQTVDTVKVKNLLAGTNITLDSTEYGITINSSGGGGGVDSLAALDDVLLTDLADKDFIQYDEGVEKWINVPPQEVWLVRKTDSLCITDGVDTSACVYAPSGVTGANNGLGLSSATVQLGGTLIQTTDIIPDLYNLRIRQDTSANTPRAFGLLLNNETAATPSNQKASPSLMFRGYGWKTASTASSQSAEVRQYVLPVQGSTAPTAQFNIERRANDGSWQTWVQFMDNGPKFLGVNGSGFGGLSFSGTAPVAQTIYSANTLSFRLSSTPISTPAFQMVQPDESATSGGLITLRMFAGSAGFAPTSGTATYAMQTIEPTINQTGGANGISRGVYVNPVLTAAADFRAIEVATGRTVVKGMAYGYASAPNSADYTVGNDDYIVELADLSGANRNIVLPSSGISGRTLRISNLSSDGTFKWSFSGGSATDITGGAVTTLTDQKIYELYWNGSTWRVGMLN